MRYRLSFNSSATESVLHLLSYTYNPVTYLGLLDDNSMGRKNTKNVGSLRVR